MSETGLLGPFDCVAPPLMWSEGLSSLSEAAFRGELPDEQLDEVVARLEALPIRSAGGTADDRMAALRLARRLGWAKTYDAEYVALAERLECELLTADARLHRGVSRLIRIRTPESLRT
jgi:predicted nucleic acid-binding protein